MTTITTRDDIQRLVRAPDADEERKTLLETLSQAKELGLAPDNWATDGTLKDGRALTDDEQRATYSDLRAALQQAITDSLPVDSEDDVYYTWVCDFTDEWVVYEYKGDMLQAPYEQDADGNITLGDPVKVRQVTTYVETNSAGPLKEWREKKVKELRGLERRTFPASDMELRDAGDGTLTLTGYASVTETPYDVGFYTETIKRGAFKRTLGESPDVQLLINHEGLPLARTKSGTLTLTEDQRGLSVQASLDPEDPDVQSLARKMKRGDIDQMSFAFQATDQEWNDDYTARDITAVSIHRGDVSVVNQGANPATAASIRSQDALRALRGLGSVAFIAAWAEWRDHTLLASEARAGKTLSASSMEVLTQVLNLVAAADDAVDEAQPMLAELMGVANPDADDAPDEPDEPQRATVIPDRTSRARQDLDMLIARSAR